LRSSKEKKLPGNHIEIYFFISKEKYKHRFVFFLILFLAHLRDLESSDDSESLNEIKSKINQQSQKSDLDYDFYN
jgi:hypothetical protein